LDALHRGQGPQVIVPMGVGWRRTERTWGPGNFDSDTAADHLGTLTRRLVDEIQAAMADPSEIEPDEYWGVAVPCNLELLTLIGRQGYVGAQFPDADTISEWRKTFMDVWERTIDGLEPMPEHKIERREVLHRTFEALLQVSNATRDETP